MFSKIRFEKIIITAIRQFTSVLTNKKKKEESTFTGLRMQEIACQYTIRFMSAL